MIELCFCLSLAPKQKEMALLMASSNILDPAAFAVCTVGIHPGLRIPISGSMREDRNSWSISDLAVSLRVSVQVSFWVNF